MNTNIRRLVIKSKQLVGSSYSQADIDFIYLNDLKRSGCFSAVERVGDKVVVEVGEDGNSLSARLFPHSDCFTLKQVFIDNEYSPLVSQFHANGLDTQNLKIVDAGANVGYTAAYFFMTFPAARIVCVEPDDANLAELNANLAGYLEEGRLVVFPNGLMDEAGKNLTTSRDFRDGKDHAITVAESDKDDGLMSTSIPEIMSRMGWTDLDILKVDIEGAERFVFKDRETAAFLESVRSVAIEIHDEFGIREHIYELLRSFGFVLIDSGETTFGLNMRFSSK